MRVRIHRGTAEIGGNCVEVEASDGSRLVVDIGRPIWAAGTDDVPLPAISGLVEADPTLHAILISHPHLDHYGLLGKVAPEVPVFMGAEAAAVLRAASFFSSGAAIEPAACFADREPLSVGPFTVTPFLNDHSAFDAYSLLIEADDRRLFYTGDIRGHGRKRALFEALLGNPPLNVDVMLMEGTNVRSDARRDTEVLESESDLELRFVDVLRGTRGAVAVVGSAQNLDRLVTVYRAARRSGRPAGRRPLWRLGRRREPSDDSAGRLPGPSGVRAPAPAGAGQGESGVRPGQPTRWLTRLR